MFNYEFLPANTAYGQYEMSDYFDQMNEYEFSLRLGTVVNDRSSGKDLLLKRYKDALRDFTDDEKNTIRFYMVLLQRFLTLKAPLILPSADTIKFIKLDTSKIDQGSIAPELDWGYPYTINHAIVLPMRLMSTMLAESRNFYISFKQKYGDGYENINANTLMSWTPNRPEYKIIFKYMTFFSHEFIHILQRNENMYPSQKTIFEKVYRDIWLFSKITKNQISEEVTKNPKFGIVTDPDGYNYQWITRLFNVEKHYDIPFLPVLMIDKSTQKPNAYLIEMVTKSNTTPYVLTKNFGIASNFRLYVERFYGETKQLNHPNEIIAIMLSEYVIQNIIYSNTTNTTDYMSFYPYVNKYIISTNFTPFRNR